MGKHLRKQFTCEEVIEVFERYLAKEIGVSEAMRLLKIGRRQFFKRLKTYRENSQGFNLDSPRSKPTHQLSPEADWHILAELAQEKQLIDDPANPIRFYNYSYIKSRLKETYGIAVSLPSIITRAKKTVIIKRVPQSLRMTAKYSRTMWEKWRSMIPLCIVGRLLLSRNGISLQH